jgi:sulfur carrier protein ThiS
LKIHLTGHLNWYDEGKRAWFELEISRTRLADLLDRLGIPQGEVVVALVNGSRVDVKEAWVDNVDTLELFPPASGG